MISSKAPLADAFTYVHLPWATFVVALGTTTTLTATTLCSLYGQPRIFFRMARDGLLFEQFGKVNTNGVPTFGEYLSEGAAREWSTVVIKRRSGTRMEHCS